mmetsp:Transcript_22654/g.73618  ORF Transcript_22654/g.73618 Transcript_22654/m.73618 type:complete len:200 (-) Transcript_22654:646-1245(-)
MIPRSFVASDRRSDHQRSTSSVRCTARRGCGHRRAHAEAVAWSHRAPPHPPPPVRRPALQRILGSPSEAAPSHDNRRRRRHRGGHRAADRRPRASHALSTAVAQWSSTCTWTARVRAAARGAAVSHSRPRVRADLVVLGRSLRVCRGPMKRRPPTVHRGCEIAPRATRRRRALWMGQDLHRRRSSACTPTSPSREARLR